MAEREGGGSKILRGVVIAIIVVVALVLIAAFRSQVADALSSAWNFISDRFPPQGKQRAAVLIYLLLAVVLSLIFSKAGHFTAYGVAMGLGPLLWVFFWEGFPPLGLNPVWTTNMGLQHLAPGDVILWAIVAAIIITVLFVPLELSEKYRVRRRRLADPD